MPFGPQIQPLAMRNPGYTNHSLRSPPVKNRRSRTPFLRESRSVFRQLKQRNMPPNGVHSLFAPSGPIVAPLQKLFVRVPLGFHLSEPDPSPRTKTKHNGSRRKSGWTKWRPLSFLLGSAFRVPLKTSNQFSSKLRHTEGRDRESGSSPQKDHGFVEFPTLQHGYGSKPRTPSEHPNPH